MELARDFMTSLFILDSYSYSGKDGLGCVVLTYCVAVLDPWRAGFAVAGVEGRPTALCSPASSTSCSLWLSS